MVKFEPGTIHDKFFICESCKTLYWSEDLAEISIKDVVCNSCNEREFNMLIGNGLIHSGNDSDNLEDVGSQNE